ncbi:hypothetical protein SELMODRAFT_114530 [Selaginella moellendorffii]|uniref:Major facilitator superfamily (MFS) profile domain-containing protein n=1 Tax=Selaginella moellendorffii TaxID=88036 RepID=D8SDB2_SELML|nr:protein NRT1/ PTR FAMILY 8.1 [Selaginella moellendorffii]EFJ17483.1 hypothetical protein SELMODRAFT_114530 [Selaginella moellendorffii]|eukprot:XP_002981295.1 protein NRT1/ PTR FAMILY 8.1 [Selaginella moellendorffii]
MTNHYDEEHSTVPLLQHGKQVSLDFYGNRALPLRTGGSRSTFPVLLFNCLAVLSLYGVSYNLVLFMVSKLGLSNAAASSQVSIWTGVHDFSPLLVAYISDSYLGTFVTTLAGSFVFFGGLALLSLAVLFLEHQDSPSLAVTWLFFVALYVVALSKGFVASLLAFGAGQFDEEDPVEAASKSSYFSWYYFCSSMGLLLAVLGVVYIEDRMGFSTALFVCGGAILLGIAVFCGAAKLYRYDCILTGNPFAKLLHKDSRSSLAGILWVWLGSVVYETMKAQTFSLFVEQAALMDTKVGGFRIPPASLNSFDPISFLVWMLVYDRVLVPVMRRATGNSRGFTFFQRMGAGLVAMTAGMACAAVLETERLANFHRQRGTIVLWQIPQFVLIGGSKVFYYVGLVEFIYERAPENLRTLGVGMVFFASSVGCFLSGFLVSITSRITGERGWIPRNLNDGHLDYFFWLLAALGSANWLFFLAYTNLNDWSKRKL